MENHSIKTSEIKILIKGAGEVASAIAHRLSQSRFKICLTELEIPLAIHRGTSYSEAVWETEKKVEGLIAVLAKSAKDIMDIWNSGKISVIVDPDVKIKNSLDFNIFIDATMPKIKTNIKKTFADLVIGIGPGYTAGKDVHIVIETNNTDRIGTWLKKGKVDPDTKIPLEVGGFTFERVLRNKTSGIFKILKDMGSIVQKGDEIARVGKEVLIAEINGCVRALMRNGVFVGINTKLGEIDPRPYPELCKIIRPRMRNISGGVLESILYWFGK